MEEPLCCCEYVDRRGRRNHLVACCCDCEELDDGCDRWLTCKSLPPGALQRIADTVADRLRVPWFSGAVKINVSLVPPLVLLPVFLHVASLHFLLGLIILTSLPVVVLWYYYLTHRRKERTLFFLSLGLFSLGYMYYVFLREVVPRGHVEYSQVVALTCGLILMLAALSRAKKDPGYLPIPASNEKPSQQGLPNKSVRGSSSGLHGVSGAGSSRAVNGEAKGYCRMSAEQPEGVKKDWCTKCQLVRPARAGHCRLCGRCVRRLDHHCVWAEIHDVLEEYKEGAAKFMGLQDAVLYCSLHDPVIPCPSGYNTNKMVSLWGSSGRMEMTASKFMDIQRAIQPDWFQCLSDGDTISGETGRKRAKKSVDRSLSFLDICLQLQEKSPELQGSVMFGAIEGGDILEERLRSARETAKRPVGGFLLDGFQGNAMAKETKLKLIASVTAELPEDKPRIIHGVGKPDEVLECIERGVDIFESFFPFQVTERGCALVFSYDCHPDPEATVLTQNGTQDLEKNGAQEDQEEVSKADPEMTPFEISLKDKKYHDDFGPLLEGCSCYCCQRHTRAYVHHLLVTNELLAGVLLMMHNFQHYFGFFSAIQDALRNSKLDQLKELVFRQALQGPANATLRQ